MLYYVLWVSARLFNKGRLLQNCIHTACVSLRFLDAIPRNDGVYIAGIIFNIRRVICCSVVDVALGGVVVCCVDAISPAEDKRLLCAAIKLIAI